MRFSLDIENVAVDLFNDESIQLVRQIKDYQDLSNSKTDFTQQFVIPSTSINDPIFQNYFDENAVFSGWNAFIKLDAQIFIHKVTNLHLWHRVNDVEGCAFNCIRNFNKFKHYVCNSTPYWCRNSHCHLYIGI